MSGVPRRSFSLGAVFGVLLCLPTCGHAAKILAYPVNTCVAAKQKAAGAYCKSALKDLGHVGQGAGQRQA